jgi:single-stranded-DNA-specific exonuclease
MYNALEACSEHLEQFGGHMYAAGMTKTENYPAFKKRSTASKNTIPDNLRYS